MIKCDSCRKFISYRDIDAKTARCDYTPLNEFGPETIEWTCKRCKK